ncbi:hypothetical protein RRG08_005407 [Elysia crispata]|uniref:Uncharacterized protein n=1 Tax=Elysia crispata TaxID=231223 RepID=A0AAE0Y1B1_9GAST|nr:hypothetical protein RRG08_005407 [Elysia crispata]
MSSAAPADVNRLQIPSDTSGGGTPSADQQSHRGYGGGQPQRSPSAAGSLPGRKRRGSTVPVSVAGEVDCTAWCVHDSTETLCALDFYTNLI